MNWAGIRFKELRYTSYIFTVQLVLPYIIPYILENLERLIKKKSPTITKQVLHHVYYTSSATGIVMYTQCFCIKQAIWMGFQCAFPVFSSSSVISLLYCSQPMKEHIIWKWFTYINVHFFHTVVTDRRPCWVGGGGGGLAGTGIGWAPYTPSSTSLFLPTEDFLWAESRVAGVFLLLEWSRHSDWWTPFSNVHVLSAGGGSSVGWWGCCCCVCCSCWRLNCSWRLRRSRSFSRWRFRSSRLQYRPSYGVRIM